jgi:hypothetical protein
MRSLQTSQFSLRSPMAPWWHVGRFSCEPILPCANLTKLKRNGAVANQIANALGGHFLTAKGSMG